MVDDSGEAEIENLHVAISPDHDVFGLDVTVDDAGCVCGRERPCDLATDLQRRRQRLRTLDERAQRLSIDKLLDDEQLTRRRFTDFVDRDDVGVVEGGGGARLAQESLDERRLLGPRVAHQFHGDRAVQPRVEGAEDLPHAAAADAPIDAVVPESGRYHPGTRFAAPASTIHLRGAGRSPRNFRSVLNRRSGDQDAAFFVTPRRNSLKPDGALCAPVPAWINHAPKSTL